LFIADIVDILSSIFIADIVDITATTYENSTVQHERGIRER